MLRQNPLSTAPATRNLWVVCALILPPPVWFVHALVHSDTKTTPSESGLRTESDPRVVEEWPLTREYDYRHLLTALLF